MSKIICEVCGTTYPETAAQCPICGYVRSADAKSISAGAEDGQKTSGTYNYVKGGRFSKKNVRKRSQQTQTRQRTNSVAASSVKREEKNNKTTAGLVITAVILLLAIIAVVLYISLHVFGQGLLPFLKGTTPETTLSAPAQTTAGQSDVPVHTTQSTKPTETEQQGTSCESITLDVSKITLDKEGSARMIYATVLPEDTTDVVVFSSSDNSVATVSADGKITAVSVGEATITATCGSVTAQCVVTCEWETATETTATTEETVPETAAVTDDSFRLNRKDITFSSKGESWVLYSGSVGKTLITWSSDDESVATFEDGTVVAVGSGMTNVHAEYNGTKVSCIIRCSFSSDSDNQGVDGNGGGVSEDGGEGGTGEDGGNTSGYRLYNPYGNAEDVSINVGDSFSLQLVDGAGQPVSAEWSVADTSCCSISGNTFTGEKSGTTKITATYNGQTYTCIVRVR